MRFPFNSISKDREAVHSALEKWHLYSPTIVATPQSTRFLPPICIPELSSEIHRRVVRRHETFLLLLIISLSILFLAKYAVNIRATEITDAILLLLSGVIYVSFDTYFVQRNIKNLSERAMFLNFVCSRRNFFLMVFSVIMVLAGIAQIILQQELGGFDNLVTTYGAYFDAIDRGEWWRYLSGPFIHASLLHWAGNFIIGILSITLAGAFGRRTLVIQFVIITSLSVVAVQYSPLGIRSDSFVGLSGGIFGMFGWSFSYFFLRRKIFPQFIWVSIGLLMVVNIICSAVTSSHVSQTAHVVGLLIGLIFGFSKLSWP